ncbi:MerR family transcriptional regulator [Arthrobacter rhombi]|uniref:Regulatory protein, MerR n=1 Tax=Arthrobacter rhombi TaxID=71253 RepID=A0A1R4FFE8_9MICC|nr:MerR family transcriptional regulator [Arthrobacter rhombi]SJM54618.1 Regulatory protein, MerR [Arthrobacter rhombi]
MPQHTPGRTMHIGELAERTGLSLRTIRHYDDVGLLPASARTDGGFRVFTETDVDRLTHIKAMKPLGFSLEEITELLSIVEEPSPGAQRVERARHFLDRTRHEREKLARYLAQADELITELEGLAGA